MKDNSVAKLGGLCAILVGAAYLVIGITYFLIPEAQQSGSTEDFLKSFAVNPTAQMVSYWAWALGALAALAAVPAIAELVRPVNEGLVRWATTLAQLGFAVTAVNYFTQLTVLPWRAADFVCVQCPTNVVQTAMAYNQNLLGLDPQGWLGLGAVGMWIMVISLLALRNNALPRYLAFAGVASGLAYWLLLAGRVLENSLLVAVVAVLGGIVLGPLWYIAVGLKLWRSDGSQVR